MEDNTPVLWMHFLPFSAMTAEEREEFQMVARYLHAYSKMHNAIYSNGSCIRNNKATRKIVGTMYGAGWRGAQVPSK